ncbi:cell wall hydrolase [Pontibacillus halophilus JSM 076056 = DSM 19796]|uniref:Cell wall hydrolase n=1 Tax=Pontibacillus halophilus JSM 076056 = DSM 19796 TaxID=1385510 RepID=A0A0A5GQN3_9BACI|nr:SH3 domain-containing protein [Pontibacillus halophilus]KGX93518.1 cell wall hydrolase [Pontibacillus halophilus JSM 076056 = DSM 19796]
MRTFIRLVLTVALFCLAFPIEALASTATVSVNALNVRSGPGITHSVKTQIHQNETYEILSSKGDWIQLDVNGKKGWVADWLVSIHETPSSVEVTSTASDLRVRKGPGLSYKVVGYLDKGDTRTQIGVKGDWVKIKTNGTEAWVHKDYVTLTTKSGENPSPEKQMVDANLLNVRSGPGIGYKQTTQLPFGTNVSVVAKDGNWYQILYGNNNKGWVSSAYLTDPTEAPTAKKQGEITVSTPVLNVRSQGSTKGSIIGQVRNGDTFSYYQKKDSWYQIKLGDGDLGWVAGWLVQEGATASPTNSSITLLHNGTNIRSGPSTSNSIVGRESAGASFQVVRHSNNWYEIAYDGGTAYVADWIVSKSSQPTQSPSRSLKGKTIVIDAGHGGRDPGAIGADGSYEKTLTLQTANAIEQALKIGGANVILTRNRDTYLPLSSRTSVSKLQRADVFLSLHYNSFPQYPSASGIGTYYYNSHEKKLATDVQQGLIRSTGLRDRGIKYGNFYVMRENRQPSLLLELGFMSNKAEMRTIKTHNYHQKVANGIIQGLNQYFSR